MSISLFRILNIPMARLMSSLMTSWSFRKKFVFSNGALNVELNVELGI